MKTFFHLQNSFFCQFDESWVTNVTACPVCKGREYNFQSFSAFHKYNKIATCMDCDCTWLMRRPAPSILDMFYDKSRPMDYWWKIKATQKEKDRQLKKYEYLYGWAQKIQPNACLDLGCGDGSFLSGLDKSVQKIAIEPNKSAQALISKRHKDIRLVEYLDDINDTSIELVSLLGVVEHLADPISTLVDVWGKMVNKGKLFVIVPNKDSMVAQVLGHKNETVGDIWCSYCPQHLMYLNIKSLTKLMKLCRFRLLDWCTSDYELQPILRKMKGIPPYSDLGNLQLTDNNVNKDSIWLNNLGSKIVSVWEKA